LFDKLDAIKKIYSTPFELAEGVAMELVNRIIKAEQNKKEYMLVLSGGNTPYFLFSILTDQFSNSINWNFVHLFWGDERCVHPTHSESNYGMALHNLIEKIDIPDENIHRIRGEMNPRQEASRYSKEILKFTRTRNGLPLFDLVILGLGEDGHTASIFPDRIDLFGSDNICEVTKHPVTSQKRITLTGRVINNADTVFFMASGMKKAQVIYDIFNKVKLSTAYPASRVVPENGIAEWFLDKDAAAYLK
jgi:6-phosphogluconolactonase